MQFEHVHAPDPQRLTTSHALTAPRRRLAIGAAIVSVAALLIWPGAAGASAPDRTPLAAVPAGNDRLRAAATRLGDLDPARQVDFQLSLQLRNQDQLRDLISRVSTPGSPEYGHYLNQQQFDAAYGPSDDTVAQTTGFLRGQGFEVTSISPGRTLIDARGSAARVDSALHTSLGDYRDPATGREFYANDSPPLLPAALAGGVLAVHGLDNISVRHSHAVPNYGAGPAGGVTPNQVKGAYGMTGGPLTGVTGTGQTIGLLELDGFKQTNVSGYDTHYYGAPLAAPTRVSIDGQTYPIPGPGEIEAELDIEVLHAYAPGAAVRVYEAPNTDVGVNDGYAAMANAGNSSNSTSWGLCEPAQGLGETLALDNIFSSAAAQGHPFFAAAGDTGAYDCASVPNCSNICNVLAADSPASDPFVTGVGGTNLQLNNNGSDTLSSYSSEVVWRDNCPSAPCHSPPLGSGGGLSQVFGRPSWQTGPGTTNSFSNNSRQVPDVASDGAPPTGYSVCVPGSSGTACSAGGFWRIVAGTSAGAPAWAAYAALYNQSAAALSLPALGFANPALYAAAQCPQANPAFHDVTVGDNLFYPATPGWDFATGLGAADGTRLTDTLNRTGASAGCGPNPAPRTHGNEWISTDANGNLEVLALATDNAIWRRVGNGNSWSGWTPLGGVFSSDPAGAPNLDGRLEVFALGADRSVWHAAQASPGGSFGAWSSLGGPMVGQPAVATNQDGRLQLFVRGGDGAIYTRWQTAANSNSWSGWASFGGNMAGEPTIGHNQDGRLQMFVRGADGGVYTVWQTAVNGNWSGFASFGGSAAGNPAVGPNQDGRLQMVVRGTDGATYTVWQTAVNANWSGWASFGGSALGSPAVGTNQDGRLQILVRGADNQVYTRWQTAVNANWSGWASFGGGASGNPNSGLNPDGTGQVFVRGNDGALWYVLQQAPNANWGGWTSLFGSLAG